jgi:hypothetical protein
MPFDLIARINVFAGIILVDNRRFKSVGLQKALNCITLHCLGDVMMIQPD